MRRHRLTLLVFSLFCACASDPLPGRWTASTTTGAITLSTTLTLHADGTLAVTDTGRGSCTGTRTYTGLTWSSSATIVAFAGTPACTGSIVCTSGTTTAMLNCPAAPSFSMAGACAYTLGSDNNTLTLRDCSGNAGTATTYTREAN